MTSKGIQLGPEEENTHNRGNDQQMYPSPAKKTNNIDGKLNNTVKDKQGNGDLDKTKQETNKSKWKASLEDLAKQRKERPRWMEDKVKEAPQPNINKEKYEHGTMCKNPG